jgi:hypothetical protein
MTRAATRRLHPAPLAALAVAVLVLVAARVLPVWPGLIHFVALPPLDLIADLRALLVYAPGIPGFIALLIVLIGVRSAVLALLLGGLTRARFWFAVRFYLVVLPFAALAAAVTYTGQAILFYGAFWAGLAVGLALTAVVAAVPWLAPLRLGAGLRRALAANCRLGTVGAYLAALFVLGLASDVGGTAVTLLAVPLSAALTWLTAQLLYADPGFVVVRRVVAVLPAAALVALAAVAYTGADRPPRAPYPEQPRDGSIMLMSGIDSSSGSGAVLEIDPHVLRYPCDQAFYFSYAGPGDGQPQGDAICDIQHGAPYGPDDTLRSRAEVVPFLEAQVSEMAPPGVVAGHSQGAWLVWEAAAGDRLPGAEVIVLVGPFATNPVGYPAAGDGGSGQVGRMVLGGLTQIARPGGTTTFSPDSPLGREWLADPGAIERTLARPLPDGIRALSVPSLFDLPLQPGDAEIPAATDACPVPVAHPNLPYAPEFLDAVDRFLAGEAQPPCPAWRYAVGPALRSFTAPPSSR